MKKKKRFKYIKLRNTKGLNLRAKVDAEDFKYLSQWIWSCKVNKINDNIYYYAVRWTVGGRFAIYMHRFIMKAKLLQKVNHRNHDTLDNRRNNIRFCTSSQIGMNRRLNRNNTSGYTGVGWCEKKGIWQARLEKDTVRYHLGYFDNLDSAIQARKAAEKKYYGKFAFDQNN